MRQLLTIKDILDKDIRIGDFIMPLFNNKYHVEVCIVVGEAKGKLQVYPLLNNYNNRFEESSWTSKKITTLEKKVINVTDKLNHSSQALAQLKINKVLKQDISKNLKVILSELSK